MLSVVLIFVSLAVVPARAVTVPPSCLYEAYGCVYYIWDHEDGTGDALATCDGGNTFSFYSGRFGGCP